MIHTRLFERDPVLGTTKYWHYDPDTDEAWMETVVDNYDAIAEDSAERRKATAGTKMGDGVEHIGQIPMALYWRLKARGVFDDQRAFRRWWQSDEATPFKVRDLWLGKRT